MNDDWRSRNTMTGREAAKAAGVILALLFICILIAWVVTKATRPEQSPKPASDPAPAERDH